jgi:hypothetical protein
MLKLFDFECTEGHRFEDLVTEGEVPVCKCGATTVKLPGAARSPSEIILSYPGSKKHKAGYVHTHNRPAEKKASQVSMYMGKR